MHEVIHIIHNFGMFLTGLHSIFSERPFCTEMINRILWGKIGEKRLTFK